jgi:hypothetical protein
LLVLALLAACAGAPPGVINEQTANFDRTFDTALGAMSDLKMVVTDEQRRQGRIVGNLGGDTIVTSVEPQIDGTVRVTFAPQGLLSDSSLPQRLAAAYNKRMSGLQILPGTILRSSS